MPFSIHVRDFQSIKDARLDVSGLTVIFGGNNSGKSALIRAFRGVFANARGTSFVRHGANYSSVTVSFHDGPWVTWEKGTPSINRYHLEGLTLHNVSHGPPEEVRALGVRSITLGDREVWPQISPQMSGPLFLVDAPGSVMAEAVSDVARVSQLNQALRASETERKEEASALKIRQKDLGQVRSRLGKFSSFPKVRDRFSSAEGEHARLVGAHAHLERLSSLRERLRQVQEEKRRLAKAQDINLAEVAGAFAALKQTRQRLVSLRDLKSRLDSCTAASSALSGSAQIDAPSIPSGLKETRTRLQKLLEVASRLQTFREEGVSHQRRLLELQEELSSVEKELSVCPTCGRPL